MQDQSNNQPGEMPPDNLPAPQSPVRQQALARSRQDLSLDLLPGERQEGGDNDEIDLRGYWQILVKRRWTILAVAVLVFLIGFVNTLLMTPIYRSSVSLQIDSNTVQVLSVEGINEVDGRGGVDFYETQYELLRSRALAERVAQTIGLNDAEVRRHLDQPSGWQQLLAFFNRADSATEDAESEVAPTEQELADQQRAIAGIIQGGTTVQPVGNSRLVRIHFDSIDGDFSVRAANAIAEAYVASNLERKAGSSGYAKEFLEARLEEMRVRLEQSERKLVEFAQRERIVETADNPSGLSQQNLTAVNSELAAARSARMQAEARARQLQSSSGVALTGSFSESSIIRRLQEEHSRLRAEYQDKLRLYKPAFPVMQQLQGQIDEIEKQIDTEMGRIRSAIQAEYLAAQERERMLEEQVGKLRDDVLDTQGRSIEYTILKRDVETNRQLYDGLLQRYKEVGLAAGVTNNNVAIIDRAQNYFQSAPSYRRNLSMALVFGLMLGVLLALAMEYLDDTFKTPDDVEKKLGLPVLGVIPKLQQGVTPAAAMEDLRSAFAEAYRSVRTALQFTTDQGAPRSLLITSPSPGEGKSTTALSLARNFALLGKRTLIIDADLRNPSLHKVLGIDNAQGLSNYLAGAAKATEVIQAGDMPHLMVMPTGPLPPNPAELLMGPKMVSLISIASEKFDQVILDGPPVLGLADAPILANMASGTLVVIEAGDTRIAVARNAIKRLLAARAHVLGTLLNKFSAKNVGYGYNYGYGYGTYSYYAYDGKDAKARLTRQ